MTGISLVTAPPRRPMGWPGPRGYVPRRGSGWQGTSRWALGGVVLALVLAGGGVAATEALPAAPTAPAGPAVACSPAAAGSKLTAEQRENATLIIAKGRAMGIPERGQVVALATAMQESRLRNLGGRGVAEDGGDRDSAGLFQQRPSQGWGSFGQVTNPEYSAATFYSRLRKLPGYEQMSVTVAAQTIQRSAYPSAYAKWQDAAEALVSGTSCERRA